MKIFTLVSVLVIASVLLSSCSRYTSIGDAAAYRNSRVRNVR